MIAPPLPRRAGSFEHLADCSLGGDVGRGDIEVKSSIEAGIRTSRIGSGMLMPALLTRISSRGPRLRLGLTHDQ